MESQAVLASQDNFQGRESELPYCQFWDLGILEPRALMISPKYGQDF